MTNNTNAGDHNTGDHNTGYHNAGDHNTGDHNTGSCNVGSWNAGDHNTGYHNAGDHNTGDHNAGSHNTGDHNTGYRNTGYWNTGSRNTGYRNTGHWNTGDWNTGYCNSITPEECYIFNKPALRSDWYDASIPEWMQVSLTKWIASDEMSDKEKTAYPSHITTGGYLKCHPDLRTAFIESWENTTEKDRELTKQLPNFDVDVFAEVFGFQPFKGTVEDKSKDTAIHPETIIINGKTYKLIEENND